MTELRASDTVAAKIRSYREWMDWSRAEMARQTGLSENVIENIETGRPDADGNRRRDVTVDELLIIARGLDLSVLHLLPNEASAPDILEREDRKKLQIEQEKRRRMIDGQYKLLDRHKQRHQELDTERAAVDAELAELRKRMEACRQMIIMLQAELRGIDPPFPDD
jgi:transcriptional regulator with XRE-family HTH domain